VRANHHAAADPISRDRREDIGHERRSFANRDDAQGPVVQPRGNRRICDCTGNQMAWRSSGDRTARD
jgi:hypothetical protein